MSGDRLHRFVERISGDRRPQRFRAGPDEASAMQAASRLHAAHPGSDLPRAEFVDELADRLRRHMEPEQPRNAGRRRFLRDAGIAVAAAGAGVAVDRIVDRGTPAPARPPVAAQPREITPTSGVWVQVATLSSLPRVTVQRFSANGIEGFLVRTGEQLQALSAICTHQGCVLQPDAAAGLLRCPCHTEASFTLDGHSAGSWYVLPPLPTLRIRTTGDAVEVLVPEVA